MKSAETPDYAVILWDNDGVLVDTERLYFQATREAFARVGVDLTEKLFLEYFLLQSEGTSKFGLANGLSEAGIAELRLVMGQTLSATAPAGTDHDRRRSRHAGDAAAALRYGNRDKFSSPAFRNHP